MAVPTTPDEFFRYRASEVRFFLFLFPLHFCLYLSFSLSLIAGSFVKEIPILFGFVSVTQVPR